MEISQDDVKQEHSKFLGSGFVSPQCNGQWWIKSTQISPILILTDLRQGSLMSNLKMHLNPFVVVCVGHSFMTCNSPACSFLCTFVLKGQPTIDMTN